MNIEEALRELREDRKGQGAPPRLEGALLAEFRTARKKPSRWRIWIVPAAAAALAAAGVVWLRPGAPVVVSDPPPVEVARAEPAPRPVVETAAPVVTARRTIRPRPAVKAPVELYSAFHPVPGGDVFAPLDRGQMVRVRLPRTAMTYFGLPVNPARGEFVKADVVLSEDGTARAIRFVQDRY